MFQKYMHIERLGHSEVEGILDGICHVFYKIDGTNASLWRFNAEENPKAWRIEGGSRNRVLTRENDNAGFLNWALEQENLWAFFEKYHYVRLYGEWLVPHSLKTYHDDAWRKFYVFDVYAQDWDESGEWSIVPYDVYKVWLDEFGIDYIPPLAIMKNPTEEQLFKALEKSGQFLIKDGAGTGEGIVIKNYDFVNQFGRQTWAKIITNEFKTVHHREMGAPLVNGSLLDEERAVQDFLTSEMIRKEQIKIIWEHNTEYNMENDIEPKFTNKMIPELLGRVYYEFVREELWNVVKKYKDPKINFRLLRSMVYKKVKEEIGI